MDSLCPGFPALFCLLSSHIRATEPGWRERPWKAHFKVARLNTASQQKCRAEMTKLYQILELKLA